MDDPKALRRGVNLLEFVAMEDPDRDDLMLAANISVVELKSARAHVNKFGNPRPVFLLLGFMGFDPNGRPGQKCMLRLSCPKWTANEQSSEIRPARKVGERIRNLARLYENPVGKKLWTLEGMLENVKLTALLNHLKEENGGHLQEVALFARRTPMRTETRPVWTLSIAVIPDSFLAPSC